MPFQSEILRINNTYQRLVLQKPSCHLTIHFRTWSEIHCLHCNYYEQKYLNFRRCESKFWKTFLKLFMIPWLALRLQKYDICDRRRRSCMWLSILMRLIFVFGPPSTFPSLILWRKLHRISFIIFIIKWNLFFRI